MQKLPTQNTPGEEKAKAPKETVDAEALRGLLKEISDTDATLVLDARIEPLRKVDQDATHE
ncbi:MAG: hypothetical protein K1X67_01365 [Fimbriimonadaceae bacterium]|nr:hypothetical protein [Fimbriimonadaceae bacterium]